MSFDNNQTTNTTLVSGGGDNLVDLLDFNSSGGNQAIISQPVTFNVIPTGGASLLEDIFGGSTAPQQTSTQQKNFTPLMMNTQQFGEQWMQNANERKLMLTSPIITSP